MTHISPHRCYISIQKTHCSGRAAGHGRECSCGVRQVHWRCCWCGGAGHKPGPGRRWHRCAQRAFQVAVLAVAFQKPAEALFPRTAHTRGPCEWAFPNGFRGCKKMATWMRHRRAALEWQTGGCRNVGSGFGYIRTPHER